MSAERLYTPDVLALAVDLANWPAIEAAELHAEMRSATCGSSLALDMIMSADERIERVGLHARACAIGQAAAAIFARHAIGLDRAAILAAHECIENWLAGESPPPGWPDLDLIARARDYPARHGAIMLPWKAALTALPSTAPGR